MVKNVVALVGLVLSMGCAIPVFRPYVGSQQAWPTAEGSIVNVKYQLPIFTSLPPTPYEVLGELRIDSWLYTQPEERHLPILCKKAEELGADALLFVQGRIYFASNYGSPSGDSGRKGAVPSLTQVNTFNPESFREGVTILAIKWIGEPPLGLPARR